jgi:ABC-2 type transport system permease protein
VVDAVRNSFLGDFASSGLLWGGLWSLTLFTVAIWWGTATFRRENA